MVDIVLQRGLLWSTASGLASQGYTAVSDQGSEKVEFVQTFGNGQSEK